MKFCENFQAILIAVDGSQKLILRTRCKMWSCAFCAAVNRSMWQAKIISGIEALQGEWAWFTLTAHSKKRTPESSLGNLRGAWDRLMKRMKRNYGKFAYVRVYEEHKDGAYHLHAIANFKFEDIKIRVSRNGKKTPHSEWMDGAAKDLKIGYYTHANNIPLDDEHHAGYVAAYVTKYIVKLSPTMKDDLGRIRHIQTSRHFPALERPEAGLDWQMKSGYYDEDFFKDMKDGIKVLDFNTGEIISSDNFLGTYVYPPDFDHRN